MVQNLCTIIWVYVANAYAAPYLGESKFVYMRNLPMLLTSLENFQDFNKIGRIKQDACYVLKELKGCNSSFNLSYYMLGF